MEDLQNKKRSAPVVAKEDEDQAVRVGLWFGLGVAAIVTVGVLALAFYTDYKENQKDNQDMAEVQIASMAHSSIPNSETEAALIASEAMNAQLQGMIAPADEYKENEAENAANIVASIPVLPAKTSEEANDGKLSSNNATQTEKEIDGAKVVVQDGVVKFYFESAKSDLAKQANEALKDVVAGVKVGRQAVISGYTDPTGNAQLNEQLSKERAYKVRDALLAAGVPESAIVMERPENNTGTGNKAEARRVEVILR